MVKFFVIALLCVLGLQANSDEALQAFKAQQYEKAFALYHKSALSGDAKAQSALSYLYANGLGVQKDTKKSVEWLEKSANNANVNAQYDLGMFYLNGNNVPQDSKKASEFLTKASEQNHADAQYNLGQMYYKGDGVDLNISKTVELFEKAANSGHKGAQQNIGHIYLHLLKFDEASQWFEKSAAKGDESAYYILSLIHI